jgi:hypothetical protein
MHLTYKLSVTANVNMDYDLDIPYTDTNDLNVLKTPQGFYITTGNKLNYNIADEVNIVERPNSVLVEREGSYTTSKANLVPSIATVSENILGYSQSLIKLPKLQENIFQNIYPNRKFILYDSSLNEITGNLDTNYSTISANVQNVYAYYETLTGTIVPANNYKSISADDIKAAVNGFNNISVVSPSRSLRKLNDYSVRIINSPRPVNVQSNYNFIVNNYLTNKFTVTPNREFQFMLTIDALSNLNSFQHDENQEYIVYSIDDTSTPLYYVVYDSNLDLGEFDTLLKSAPEYKEAYAILPKYLTLTLTNSYGEYTNLLLLNEDFTTYLKGDDTFYNSIKTTYEIPI